MAPPPPDRPLRGFRKATRYSCVIGPSKPKGPTGNRRRGEAISRVLILSSTKPSSAARRDRTRCDWTRSPLMTLFAITNTA